MALESEGDRSGSGRLLHAVVGLLAAVVLAGAALLVYLGMTGEKAEALQGSLRDQRSMTAEVLRAMGDLAVADAGVPPRLRAVADRVRAARGSFQAAASAAHLAEASAATVEGVEAAWAAVSARLDDLQRATSDLASQGGEGPARSKARADVSKAASAALAGLDEVRSGLDRFSAAAERPGVVRLGTVTLAPAEITTAIGFVSALLVVVAIGGLRLARARAQQMEHDGARTDRAAARMAQELAPLADGDLRVRVRRRNGAVPCPASRRGDGGPDGRRRRDPRGAARVECCGDRGHGHPAGRDDPVAAARRPVAARRAGAGRPGADGGARGGRPAPGAAGTGGCGTPDRAARGQRRPGRRRRGADGGHRRPGERPRAQRRSSLRRPRRRWAGNGSSGGACPAARRGGAGLRNGRRQCAWPTRSRRLWGPRARRRRRGSTRIAAWASASSRARGGWAGSPTGSRSCGSSSTASRDRFAMLPAPGLCSAMPRRICGAR